MTTITLETKITTIEDIVTALERLPPERLSDVLQFIEFVEYQLAVDDTAEDEALWQAVEANQAYKQQHPEELLESYSSGAEFLKAMANL